MRSWLGVLGLLAGVLGLLVEHAAAQITVPNTGAESFTVSGTVLDSATAKPIERAEVTLQPATAGGQARVARTDGSGSFAFPDIPFGIYELSATRQSYTQGEAAFQSVTLASGSRPGQYTLKLLPQAVLTGVVSTEDGDPIAAAQVIVLRPGVVKGTRILLPREVAKTDEQGAFRLSELGPGLCYLGVQAQASNADAADGMAYPVTFYPNAVDPLSAQTIDLQPGLEQQANVTLPLVQAFRIRGTVTPPANETTINLIALSEAFEKLVPAFQRKLDPKTHTFELSGVPPGTYVVAAGAKDRNGRDLAGYRQVTVNASDAEGVNLTLSGAPPLTGTIHFTGDPPAQPAVSLIGIDAMGAASGAVIHGSNFSIQDPVPPGNYRLVTAANGDWYIQSATQNGQDILRGHVVIADAGSTPPLQITASPRGATLEATVNWPEQGHRTPALVTVLEANAGEMVVVAEAKMPPPGAPVNASPAFIRGLRPGRFVVYAWPEPVTVEYAKPGGLRPFDAFAQEVVIEEGQRAHVGLNLAVVSP